MGGDNSPDKTIEGIKIFLDKNKLKNDFILNVFGKEDIIKEKIKKFKVNSNSINIINSDKIVSDEESPLTAVKNSKIQVCGILFNINLRENQILVYLQVTRVFYW